MKKVRNYLLLLLVIVSLFFSSIGTTQIANAASVKLPQISAKSAIVIDAKTGKIIYGKNPYARSNPASTTKVLTAILAIEKLSPDKVLTASRTAVSIEKDASNAGIKQGERMKVINFLYAMLLDSANEAANVLAEGTSGNLNSFANLMNNRAKEMGAKNSHFVTAHGYDRPGHYTTAYDMSRIAMYAMKNSLFRKIVATSTFKIASTNKHSKGIYLSNTNKLINRTKDKRYFYPYAIGIKTGYTSHAKHCLVAAAKKGDKEFITVIYGSDNAFSDAIRLFNYAFSK